MAPKNSPEDEEMKLFYMPFSGKWRPALEPGQLDEGDFRTLTNMRYTTAPGIRSVKGMSKINTTALATA